MANTYTQIHIQAVFAVRNRQSLIQNAWKNELYKYITGIIQNYGHKVLQINGMPDHIHILIGMRPNQSISELLQQIKKSSTDWINENNFLKQGFSWQSGYGAFSYTKSQIPTIIKYIQKQEEHHKKKSFQEEYLGSLNEYEIEYDERYIFKPIDY